MKLTLDDISSNNGVSSTIPPNIIGYQYAIQLPLGTYTYDDKRVQKAMSSLGYLRTTDTTGAFRRFND